MGTETTMTSNIQLADGTELTCQLNGTEYETDSPVDESIFSEENLAVVIIDGERKTNQVLNSCYAFGSGSRFSIRDMTAEEQLNKQITDTQIGLAEVYEMILG